jgi:serine/threonine-protein kinase
MKSSGSLDLPVYEATEDSDRRPNAGAIAWLLRLARDPTRVTRASRASARATLKREELEDSEAPPVSAPLPSEQPRYVDICEISHGGMGRVRLVRDTTLRREVAMKLLATQLASHESAVVQFIEEAQITAQMDHPNIVPVYELGVDANGTAYFTMKAVRGQSLYDWLAEPRRPPGSAERLSEGLEILLKVCDAVAFAHSRGVIHRDLKSDNVMVGEYGAVYVVDWGLALVLREGVETIARKRKRRSSSSPIGTVAYMSPEAARGEVAECDERTDVFGLGAILYEIVTGAAPYHGGSTEILLERAKAGDYTPLEEALDGIGISRKILRIVRRAMSRARSDRYATAAEFKEEVQRFLRGGSHLPRLAFAPGMRIITEGEMEEAAYVIVRGHCELSRRFAGQRRVLQRLGPGDVFGETALVVNTRRTATVDAIDAVTVLVVRRSDLEEELGRETWVWALLKALAQRFIELDAVLRPLVDRR